MTVPARGLILEVLEDGIVQETIRLGVGRWCLGESPRVDVLVGEGGCWVEGPVKVDSTPSARAELHAGSLVSFGVSSVRAWPKAEAPLRPTRLQVTSQPRRRQGLSLELRWRGQLVEQWQTNATEVHLPADRFALEGYAPGKRIAMRAGDSYRFFVPNGWEASEPVTAHETVVPALRTLTLGRRGMQLCVSLATVSEAGVLRRVGAAAAAVVATLLTVAIADVAVVPEALRAVCVYRGDARLPRGLGFVVPVHSAPPGERAPAPWVVPINAQVDLVAFGGSFGEARSLASTLATCASSQSALAPSDLTLRWLAEDVSAPSHPSSTPFEQCATSAVVNQRLGGVRPAALWLSVPAFERFRPGDRASRSRTRRAPTRTAGDLTSGRS